MRVPPSMDHNAAFRPTDVGPGTAFSASHDGAPQLRKLQVSHGHADRGLRARRHRSRTRVFGAGAKSPRRLQRLARRACVVALAGLSAAVIGHISGDGGGPVELPPLEPREHRAIQHEIGREDASAWVGVAYSQTALPPVLAMSDDIRLHVPTAHPAAIGFHEASAAYSRALTPVGRLVSNRNASRAVTTVDEARPNYLVLSSRGRPYASTSSVDVAMYVDDPVLSPVDGVVADVRDYLLYGRYRDTRIEIVPDGTTDAIMVMLHVDRATVQAGDTVSAGSTPIAETARLLPFGSHIDRDVPGGARLPHVHIEVRDADSPRPDPLS